MSENKFGIAETQSSELCNSRKIN